MGKRKNENGVEVLPFLNEEMDTQKSFKKHYKINVKCKNKKQKEFLNLLKDEHKQICFGVGSAGTGKSYISLSYALLALKDKELPYERVVCFVPTCEAGAMNLGLLKGTIQEKMWPYVEADMDTIEKILKNSENSKPKQIVQDLVNDELIEYRLVNFARGSTIDNAIILISEAENFSKEEMLLLLTRIGENSKIILTGDLEQLDRKDIIKSKNKCGLEFAIEKLSALPSVGVVEFNNSDIVRNPLIGEIIDLWKK